MNKYHLQVYITLQSILSDFCFLIARITASVTGQSFQIQIFLNWVNSHYHDAKTKFRPMNKNLSNSKGNVITDKYIYVFKTFSIPSS